MNLISVSNVTLAQGGRTVLSGVSMRVERGKITTIVGPNGSGKSSLIKGLVGALTPTQGSITRAHDVTIGYVPQKLSIDQTLPITVGRFMNLPKRSPKAARLAALAETGADALIGKQMTALSGGQFQRVLLARALLSEPDLLILDEPTQGLDQSGSAAFYRQIEALRQARNCAIVMVSHELHVVMSTSDHVICLNGHICCQGAPAQVASAPEYKALFGSGTEGALALYRHAHDHDHHNDHKHAGDDVDAG